MSEEKKRCQTVLVRLWLRCQARRLLAGRRFVGLFAPFSEGRTKTGATSRSFFTVQVSVFAGSTLAPPQRSDPRQLPALRGNRKQGARTRFPAVAPAPRLAASPLRRWLRQDSDLADLIVRADATSDLGLIPPRARLDAGK